MSLQKVRLVRAEYDESERIMHRQQHTTKPQNNKKACGKFPSKKHA
jgi:hypothetical protein